MIRVINLLNKKFPGRWELIWAEGRDCAIKMTGTNAVFRLNTDLEVWERGPAGNEKTTRSRWAEGILQGKVRNEAGEMVSRENL